MHPYEQLIYDRFAQAIKAWDTAQYPDIYAISLHIDSGCSADEAEREVYLQGQILVVYNTLTYCETQVARGVSRDEAKWSTADWPRSYIELAPRAFPYGGQPPDDDLRLRDRWCESLGIPPDGLDGGGRPVYNEPALYEAVRGACQIVVQALHQNGVIARKIGKPIPVIIEEHENPLVSAEATRSANPPGLSQEAEEQLLGRTYAQIDAYRALLQEIGTRPIAEQVVYWRDALLDFTMKRPSAVTERLGEMKRTKYDVLDALAALGSEASPALLNLVEEYALQEQYHHGPDPAGPPDGWTPENEITEDAIRLIYKIGNLEDIDIERLVRISSLLFQESVGQSLIGTNLSALTSALHALRPTRFPQPRIGGRDNKLLNHGEFGLPSNVG